MVQVSILVPVYKCENFIYKCVDSLFSQTFEDIEFIFYDDCSPDKSVKVIESCLKKYPNRKDQVKIISGKYNIGVAAARNRLLAEANGEYIWYIDSDDWIEPDSIALLYHTAMTSNVDVVSFGFYCESMSHHTTRHFIYKSKEECLSDVIGSNWGVVWRFFFKRSIVINNEIVFPLGYKGGEDYVFCVKYLFHAKSIVSVDIALYHYVVYNMMSLIATKDIQSLVHQYDATLVVEVFLLRNNVLPLYSKDLDLRKSYVVGSFNNYFSHIWGQLYLASWKRMAGRYKQKIKNIFGCIIK